MMKTASMNPRKNKRPDRTTMDGMIYNANQVLDQALSAQHKKHSPDLQRAIPNALFRQCEGIVLLNVIEAAFLFSANVGTGVLMAHNKHDNTWSAPSAVGLTGVGWGFIGGAAMKDIVVFIMDKETMNTFSGDVQFKLGGQASLAVGDVGREVDASLHASNKGVGATVAFTYSKGFLAGVALQGSVVAPRTACNSYFYGSNDVTPQQILYTDMEIPANRGVEELHGKLKMLAERGTKKVAQTQTEDNIMDTKEDAVVVSLVKQQAEEKVVLSAPVEEEVVLNSEDAVDNDGEDSEDLEFIVSSEEIEKEMKEAAASKK